MVKLGTHWEKLSLLAGATFNQYSALTDNDKAWGMLPIELMAAFAGRCLKISWLRAMFTSGMVRNTAAKTLEL